ncbi:hypothetical protein DSECCO2_432850 [anaerobic digester metagenome]
MRPPHPYLPGPDAAFPEALQSLHDLERLGVADTARGDADRVDPVLQQIVRRLKYGLIAQVKILKEDGMPSLAQYRH